MFEQDCEWSGRNRAPFEPRYHVLVTISNCMWKKVNTITLEQTGNNLVTPVDLLVSCTYIWIHLFLMILCVKNNIPYHLGDMH